MKSLKNLTLAAIALVSLVLVGCKKENYQKPAEIGVSHESISIVKDGGESSIRLFTNRDWTATVDYSGGKDSSWISVGPDKGTASADSIPVALTVLANQGEDRQATITFSTGTLSASVRVSQEGTVKKTYTPISKVRELYKDANVKVTEDWVIKGVVLSDYRQESAGGLNNATSAKSVVIADSTAGIQLYLAANNSEFAKGDEVEVTLKDLELQRYQNGSLQVNAVPLANVKKVGEGVKVEPIAITAEQLLTGNYESRYVAVSDVQTTSAEEQTFVKGESHTSVNFMSKKGEAFVLFSSKYSTFGAEKVPTGSGTLKGIAMVYGGNTYQISITSKEDYAGLTGARFDVEVDLESKVIGDYTKWSALTPVTAFADDFSSIEDKFQEYVNDNWMFYTNDGSKVNFGWKTNTYNSDKYIEIAPYESMADKVVAYALLPKANVKGATKKALSFKIALYYKTMDDSKFEVVVSEDFTGDFEKATWTVIKDATFAEDAKTNEWTEISVDLAAYAEKEALCIALRYTGKSNTYRLDDVIIGDGVISGGGDEGDEEGDGDEDVPQSGEYTSNLTLPTEDNSTDAYYGGNVVIDGVEYPMLKLGRGSVGGKYTFSSLPVTGNCTLSFYGVAWKEKPCKLTISITGGKIEGAETATQDLASNNGAAGNPPFKQITFASTDKYTFNLTDVTESATITFSTQNETGPRGIFTGINLVAASAE